MHCLGISQGSLVAPGPTSPVTKTLWLWAGSVCLAGAGLQACRYLGGRGPRAGGDPRHVARRQNPKVPVLGVVFSGCYLWLEAAAAHILGENTEKWKVSETVQWGPVTRQGVQGDVCEKPGQAWQHRGEHRGFRGRGWAAGTRHRPALLSRQGLETQARAYVFFLLYFVSAKFSLRHFFLSRGQKFLFKNDLYSGTSFTKLW